MTDDSRVHLAYIWGKKALEGKHHKFGVGLSLRSSLSQIQEAKIRNLEFSIIEIEPKR